MARLSLLLLLGWLGGCTQWYYDLGTPLAEDYIPEQGATLSWTLQRLGPPQRVSATPEGYVLAWEYWRIRDTAIGFSLGALGADMLSVDWGSAQVRGDFMLLSFDRKHRLQSSSFAHWDRNAGTGAAVQPFFGVSLVEVDDLVRPMPQHRWGATSLQRLPEALNTPSSPDAGEAGLEQRGTPSGTGQRSLEMD